jgi:formamidopyrimidine-DNA glycosylase
MPELPEVETTRRGIEPHLLGQRILHTHVYQPKLRWPVNSDLHEKLQNQAAHAIERRAKYILIRFAHGSLIIHLGMSGSLRLIASNTPRLKHDHIEWVLANGLSLRLHDPRRFGAVLWTDSAPETHPLLAKLGIEPLDSVFDAHYLHAQLGTRKSPIKPALMNAHIVVGIGNIYANEALFLAGSDLSAISAARSAPPLPKAALPCVTLSAPRVAPAISNKPSTCTDAAAKPVEYAARRLSTSPKRNGAVFIARCVNMPNPSEP